MPVHGFGTGLIDFAFFILCAYFADINWEPGTIHRRIFFVFFVLLSLLFFLAWIGDLGARL